jgi:hypothetical protein
MPRLADIIRKQAEKYNIQIFQLALNWCHAHLILKVPTRESYYCFIRTVTAVLLSFFLRPPESVQREFLICGPSLGFSTGAEILEMSLSTTQKMISRLGDWFPGKRKILLIGKKTEAKMHSQPRLSHARMGAPSLGPQQENK